MPSTPISWRASFTESSLEGLDNCFDFYHRLLPFPDEVSFRAAAFHVATVQLSRRKFPRNILPRDTAENSLTDWFQKVGWSK